MGKYAFSCFRCNIPAAGLPAAPNAGGGPCGGCIPRRPPGRADAKVDLAPALVQLFGDLAAGLAGADNKHSARR